MLSLSKGRCIGKIVGGQYNGKFIRIFEEGKDYKCCNWCSDKCAKMKKKKCCKNCKCTLKGGCGSCSLNGGNNKIDKKRIEINLNDGVIEPVTNPEKNDDGSMIADTVFVAGPQGVGKSTVIGKYVQNELDHYPKKDVIIFSNFEEDKALDVLKPIRIKIDDKIIKKPIKKEECRNSICIFDDIDTIQPKTLAEALRAVRDDFLQCGRKENIKVLATSHQLMNYTKTRDMLNSCNKIIIFPRGTSPYHTTRLLKEYVGLDKNSIKYILKLPSRWILIDKTFPSYALHEHGAVMLNELPTILNNKKDDDGVAYGKNIVTNTNRYKPASLLLKLKELKFNPNKDKITKDQKGFIRGGNFIPFDDSDYDSDSDSL